MDLPTAMALTDVAMKTTVVSGQNLNESLSNMVGFIRILGLESVADIDRFMGTLFAAAYRTNEALAESGRGTKGLTLAMDSVTDAMQRMLPGMVDFGFTQEQMAAIASVFITNLDEQGQGIGAYSAKLFEAIKNNIELRDVYKEVNVELRRGPQLLAQMTAGYLKMTPAQRDVASSATSIGIGAHIVATAWKSLAQMEQRAIDIGENHNLLNIKTVEMMETLAKKQDQLKVSMQAVGIAIMNEYLPHFKTGISLMKDWIDITDYLSKALIGAPMLAIKELMEEPIQERTFMSSMKAAGSAIKNFFSDQKNAYEEYKGKVLKVNEEMIKSYLDMQLNLKKGLSEMGLQGVTAGMLLILEDAKRLMKIYSLEMKIATNNLGVFASKQEISATKTRILNKELEELGKLLPDLLGLPRIEVAARVSEINKQLGEMETHYGNIVELAERLANATYEGPPTLGEMVQKTRDLSKQFEDISVRGMKGIIDQTKTWRNILEDIGEVVLEEIIRKIVRMSIGAESSFNWLGTIASAMGVITGFGGTKPITSATSTVPAATGIAKAHEGGSIADIVKGLPSFQYGGEIPIMAKPGEFMVREGPAQRNMELLKAINAGREVDGNKQITYTIYAVDARSFQQLLYQNKASIHGIVQEASRVNKVGFRNMER